MSLITSCPACGTMFRVVADQLKISEGWVRCGHCAEVFDATAHMADEPPMSRFPPDAELAMPPEAPPRQLAGWDATRPADLSSRPGDLASRPDELSSRPADLPTQPGALEPGAEAAGAPKPRNVESAFRESRPRLPPAAAPAIPDSALEPSDLDAPFVFRRSDLMEPDPVPSVMPALLPGSDSRYPNDDEDAPAGYEDVSFVRQARRKAFWRRPMVRLGLTLVSLLLAAALVVQVARQDRDRLALTQPQLRPALEQMCALLDCTIGPPRQIEAIVIDASGFNRLRGDTYRLSFTLRNTAPTLVAAPAMELTLTDTQDQPILRRVLQPGELGARGGVIAAGAEWNGTVGINVNAGAGNRVAGYRLLAFYP